MKIFPFFLITITLILFIITCSESSSDHSLNSLGQNIRTPSEFRIDEHQNHKSHSIPSFFDSKSSSISSSSSSSSSSESDSDRCTKDSDCGSQHICDQEHRSCRHKHLFPDISFRDVAIAVILFLGSAISTPVGIGGGGLFMPVIAVVGNFTLSQSVPLSTATMTGSAISNFMVLWRRRHSIADRPVIHYQLSAAVLPSLLSGTIVGVFLNLVLPKIIVVAMMILVLGFATFRISSKGIQKFKAGRREMKHLIQEEEEEEEEVVSLNDANHDQKMNENQDNETTLLINSNSRVNCTENNNNENNMENNIHDHNENNNIDINVDNNKTNDDDNDDYEYDSFDDNVQQRKLRKILAKEASRCPFDAWIILLSVWMLLLLSSLIRGSKKFDSIAKLNLCSPGYWVTTVLTVVAMMGLTILMLYRLNYNYKQKLNVGFQFVPGDIQWTGKKVLVTLGVCSFAGLLAGMLSVGGGMFVSLLMIEFGVPAPVTAASSAFIIMFIVSSTTMQYFIATLGSFAWDYALFYMAVSFVAAIGGQFGIKAVLNRIKNSQAITVLLIAALMGASTIVMAVIGIDGVVKQVKNHEQLFEFSSICS